MKIVEEIEFPKKSFESIKDMTELFSKMLTDGILLLANGIAILSILKFIVEIINGFTTKSYMGTSSMDDTSFFGRKDWNKTTTTLTSRGITNLDRTFK